MWLKLLAFHYPGMAAYQKSDQAFIDEWESGDRHVRADLQRRDPGRHDRRRPSQLRHAKGFTIPAGFSGDCPNPNMDCAAETTILSYFVEPTVGGANAKAVQTSGMEASRASLGASDLGVAGVKLLSQSTAQFTAPSAQILGGAQFNPSFSDFDR